MSCPNVRPPMLSADQPPVFANFLPLASARPFAQNARRFVAVVTSVAMLAACTTRGQRIGADDGTDACRTYVVQLDSTGNFFAEDILTGAAGGALAGGLVGGLATGNLRGALIGAGIGAVAGAAGGYLAARQRQNTDQAALNNAVAGDLGSENQQLDRTQVAFNQLMDCRFKRAEQVRQAYRAGQLPRGAAEAEMSRQRTLTQRDIQLAQAINEKIGTRGGQFDTAIDTVAPGVKDRVIATRRSAPVVTAQARAPVILRLRPDPGAPEVGRLPAAQAVQLRSAPGAQGRFAVVELQNGQRGYAETTAFATRGARGANVPVRLAPVADEAAAPAQGGDVRQLAAGNIARRDNFTESVQTASAAATGGGFELAS